MPRGLLPAVCKRCGHAWYPQESDVGDWHKLIALTIEIAAHMRDEHGDEEKAILLERHALRIGSERL